MSQQNINTETLKSYFEHILRDKINTFSLLTENSHTVVNGYGVFHSDFKGVLDTLASNPRATLHVTCNITNLQGRKKENFIASRFLLLDLDRCITDTELNHIYSFNPYAVVTSSPNKFHFYWLLCHSTTLNAWSTLQLGLNNYFGGDLSLRDIAKTIRVPGVRRLTKQGDSWVPELFLLDDNKIRNVKSIVKLMPFIMQSADDAKKRLKLEAVEKFKLFKAIRNESISPLVTSQTTLSTKVKTEGRNNTMYLAIIDFVTTSSLVPNIEEVGEYALKLNALFIPPLDVTELEIVCGKAYKKGLENRRKRLEHLISIKKKLRPL